MDLLGNVFIHNAARSRLSSQMAEPCASKCVILTFLSSVSLKGYSVILTTSFMT